MCATRLPGGGLAGDLPLGRLDWRLLEAIYADWEVHGVGPQGRSRYASTVSKVLDHAKRHGWLSANPAKDARRPRVPTNRPVVPTVAEVHEALERARSSDFQLFAIVIGLASIGCRRSELLALRLEHMDLDAGVLTICAALADGGPGVGIYYKATKRNDWRDVPLTAQVVDVFREWLRRRRSVVESAHSDDPDSYLFSDSVDGSTPMRPDTITQRWLSARGSNAVTFAMLRRYVATQLLDVTDGDYRTVASITGNSEETLRRWYDAGPNLNKKRAVVALARLEAVWSQRGARRPTTSSAT